jgi:hypothetical protein
VTLADFDCPVYVLLKNQIRSPIYMAEGGEPKQDSQIQLRSPIYMAEGGEPKQDSQNLLRSPIYMAEGGEPK